MTDIIGSNIINLKEINSTNSFAKSILAQKKATNGTVVVSDFQKQGKGYKNNVWESENGKNILASIIVFPNNLKAENQFLLSMIISNGIIEYLDDMKIDAKIKWPNDIYVQNKKIAGLLIENNILGINITSSIIGIGLNINQTKFVSKAPNPISLALLTKNIFQLNQEHSVLFSFLNKWYQLLEQKQSKYISDCYHKYLYRKNETHKFVANNKTFTGTIMGVDLYGQLQIIDSKQNKLTFGFKEIEFII